MPNSTTYFQPLIEDSSKLSGGLVSYNTTATVNEKLTECVNKIQTIEYDWGDYTFESTLWVLSPTAPSYYTQTLTVTGMSADYNPTLIPDYSSFTTKAQVTAMQEALSCLVEIETASGTITGKVFTQPKVDIKFQLVGR